jgi:hypothetical protein
VETLCTYMPVSRKQACSSETVNVKLSKALPMKRMAPCDDDCIGLLQKVGASEKQKRIGTVEEEQGTAQCSRHTAQCSRDTLSPLDKIVKCWDALREPKLCWLHQMLPDVPAEYLDRLDALHDGDIPDDVFLKLRAEPWKLPELPSPSDSPE